MKKIALISGGIKSGKSAFAEGLAALWGGDDVTYIATADCLDAEMKERIKIHKARRPKIWKTIEGSPFEIIDKIAALEKKQSKQKNPKVLLLDCITLWITRLMFSYSDVENMDALSWKLCADEIDARTDELLDAIPDDTHFIAVTSEVGYSLVSPNLLGRRFQDLNGRINQSLAAKADCAALVSMGLPLWLKGSDIIIK